MVVNGVDWRIGAIGFGYPGWRGVFYPRKMKPADFLTYYSMHFDCVELDTTFHAIPSTERVKKWASQVPEHFKFLLKTPKQITHDGDLLSNIELMKEFVDVIRGMEGKLGVILLQFSPFFDVKYQNALKHFLDTLPSDLRFAVEFRHPSWQTSATFTLLNERRICHVANDHHDLAIPTQATCDFQYIRWLGVFERFPEVNHVILDMTERLEWWKQRILIQTKSAKTVYATFSNDFNGFSIPAIEQLMKMVGITPKVHRADISETLFG